MATSKECKNLIMEELAIVGDVTCRPMMGEYLLYLSGVLFGGIYDERLLVKKTKGNAIFNLLEEIPYDGAKPMYLVAENTAPERLKIIIETTAEELKAKKK